MSRENKKWIIIMPLILALTLAGGIWLGGFLKKDKSIYYNHPGKLSSLLYYIESRYVDNVSRDDLVEQTIPMVLKNLDPHSVYIPLKDVQAMNEPLEGKFDGIGIQFNIQNDTIVVINTISGGPSEVLGIMPGDRIVTIEDSLYVGSNIDSDGVMDRLRGNKGTIVKIGIKRRGIPDLISYEITRGKIPLHSVDVAYMINETTGYIKISRFALTTHEEFIVAATNLINSGMNKLVLDLRGNGGGYMDGAINIADEFLSADKLIVYTEGAKNPRESWYSTTSGLCQDMEVAVLIDEWSASASEIVSGALQDNDRGIIVGRRSFGKGLVQEPTVFPDGSALRMTIARYYTPTGRCIQKPYDNIDFMDYYHDIGDRIAHGEFEQEDSVKFADSLKFITPEGKVVYGGGGIMPDVFVGVDTTGSSKYLTSIISKGLLYKYAFEYVDTNRAELGKLKNVEEIIEYLDNSEIFKKFIKYTENKGVNVDEAGLQTSAKILNVQLKAYIARNLMDNEGYFPVIGRVDKTLTKAVELLSD